MKWGKKVRSRWKSQNYETVLFYPWLAHTVNAGAAMVPSVASLADATFTEVCPAMYDWIVTTRFQVKPQVQARKAKTLRKVESSNGNFMVGHRVRVFGN